MTMSTRKDESSSQDVLAAKDSTESRQEKITCSDAIDGEKVLSDKGVEVEDGARTGTDDLEALGRLPSEGPAYSVFSKRKKQYIVFMTAWAGLFSPLSSSTYFPAINTLATDLKVSDGLINLTLTSYLIFQGLAPTVFGDLSDMAGRRPAYFLGFVIYILANIGLATQHSYAALFILRCLQSTGSSGTIALGNGVVADISSSSERGFYMGMALSGPMASSANVRLHSKDTNLTLYRSGLHWGP